jgi:hypothetical protein
MEATPPGQVGDAAVAVNCTVELTVAPLVGAVTTTPASAELAKDATRHTRRQCFLMLMQVDLQLDLWRSGVWSATTVERILWTRDHRNNEKNTLTSTRKYMYLRIFCSRSRGQETAGQAPFRAIFARTGPARLKSSGLRQQTQGTDGCVLPPPDWWSTLETARLGVVRP